MTNQTGQTVTVCVVAKNEERTIAEILRECRPYCDELVVVDGHSTDRTRDVSAENGATVYLDAGLGKGSGIRKAIEVCQGDIIVFIDADGSHDPADIPKLTEPIKKGDADLVIGSRMRGGSDELHGDIKKFVREAGSHIITLGINYCFGVHLTDSQNGFRAIRTSAARVLQLQEDITTIEQEMLIKTLQHGFKVGEVPSHEYQRRYGDSVIKLRRVAFRYVYSWLKYLFLGKYFAK